MIASEQIKQYIESRVECEHVEVAGDGHHFEWGNYFLRSFNDWCGSQ